MTRLYDYENNIKITKTPNGDYVLTMNDAILTAIENAIHEGAEHQKEDDRIATSSDTMRLLRALWNKHEEASMND